MPKNETDQGSSIKRAKVVFLVNLGLFAGLVLIWIAISGSDETTAPVEIVTTIVEEPVLSDLELAYLKGEMQALREHPGTLPTYEAMWVLKISKQEIERDPDFGGVDAIELEQLTQAYFNGYTQRFDEYFDHRHAREVGYRFGVKCNPALINQLGPPIILKRLTSRKAEIIEQYNIPDEATWRLFCEVFQKGFDTGYWIIEDGVTANSRSANMNIEF